jgi:hypothetical protein
MIDLVVQAPLMVFGGPYSNLRALTALRARADELGIPASHCICTGDVVAYCAEPEETTAAIRAWGCHVVAGNCEEHGVPFIEKVGRGAWLNPGVIGMPANDGTPDVWYGLIGLEAGHILLSTRRLAYDHHGAAAAMRRSGHADGYARTLVTGVWPSLDVLPPTERAATGFKLRQRTVRIPARIALETAAAPNA